MKNQIFKYSFISYCAYIVCLMSLLSCNRSKSTTATRSDIMDAVFANGYVIKENQYIVTALGDGYLAVSGIEEGDTVSQGMPLFQLSSEIQTEQLENARVNYQKAWEDLQPSSPRQAQVRLQIDQARVQRKLDSVNFNRYQQLIKTNAISRQEFDRAQAQLRNSEQQVRIVEKSLDDLIENLKLNLDNAETQLKINQENTEDYQLRSSIDGILLEKYKEDGELVRRGEPIAKIGGGSYLARLFVAEEDIQLVQVGQEVMIALNTMEDSILTARVSRVYPTFDSNEQSFVIEAAFAGAPILYTNTQLQANIIIYRKEKAVVIPSEYLLSGDSVLLSTGNRVPLKIGVRNTDWVEVLSGLDVDQEIEKEAP